MIVKRITDKQKEQLFKVTPSKDSEMEYRPCQVTLRNGDTLDNVYVVEKDYYLQTWGIMPDSDSGKRYILIEDVAKIRESPNRLRVDLANKIYKNGESGMGYYVFKILFDNGQTINVVTGGAVDFVPLPDGLTTNNIIDVLLNQDSSKNYTGGPEYFWCLFTDDTLKT